MRLVVSEFMSLDGVVQGPGTPEEDIDGGFAHGGWLLQAFDPETMPQVMDEVMGTTDALLYGRKTRQTMAAARPHRAGDPFADRMNAIDKYVASRTLTEDDLRWSNSHLFPADDAAGGEIQRLKDKDGGSLQVMGSASLVRTRSPRTSSTSTG